MYHEYVPELCTRVYAFGLSSYIIVPYTAVKKNPTAATLSPRVCYLPPRVLLYRENPPSLHILFSADRPR